MANILGIQTVDNVLILSVDSNPASGLGTPSDVGSFAIAKDGSGIFYKSGIADTSWTTNVSAPYLGIARYVYLVQDASDAIKLGGSANNTYTTFQSAYDAAVILQNTLGGTNKVSIIVGNVTSVSVGDLTLTTDWNNYVSLVGISKNDSVVGNIIADNASGNGFSIIANFSNITIGNVNSDATGVNGDGGYIEIIGENLVVGNISASVTDVTNTNGNSGSINVNLQSNARNVIYGDINLTSGSSGYVLGLTIQSAQGLSFGNITLNGNIINGSTNVWIYGNINITSLSITAGLSSGGVDMYFSDVKFNAISIIDLVATTNINLQNCVSNSTNITSLGTTNVNINGCDFADILGASSRTYLTNSTVKTIAENSSFYQITNLGNNSRLQNCSVGSRITNIGTGCVVVNCSFNGVAANITNGSAVTVIGDGTYFRTAPSATVTVTNKYSTPATVRSVYLVNDASDAAKLGGVGNNVYTTFQTAYDAANTLQIALGGLNRVIIVVGNTVAATVGNVALSANWNSLVEIVGIAKSRSLLGNITITGVFSISTSITNATVGNITAQGGIGLTLNNSTTGNLVTTSSTGAAGSVGISNSNDSSVGQITMSSSLGNVGSLTFSNSNDITVTGNVTITQTSTTTSFSVGSIAMTTCNGIRFNGTVTMTMAYASSSGTIGGLNIDNTNQNISFAGNVRVTGYSNNTNTSSNVAITNIYCVNCTFSGLFINHQTVGDNTWEGGVITTVNFHKCFFRTTVRIAYNNTTEITTGVTFRMTDSQMIGSTNGSALDFTVYTKDVSFDSFVLQDIESNFQGSLGYNGIAISNNLIATPTVMFTIDGVSALFTNINGNSFSLNLQNPTTANSTYDAIVLGCSLINLSLQVTDGDVNFKVVDSSSSNNYYLINWGTTSTKRTDLIGCNLNTDSSSLSFAQIPITLKNTYLGYYTDTDLNQDVISYNSYVESYSVALTITTWSGTFNTSTLRRLVTDVVAGVTFNNSYDESY